MKNYIYLLCISTLATAASSVKEHCDMDDWPHIYYHMKLEEGTLEIGTQHTFSDKNKLGWSMLWEEKEHVCGIITNSVQDCSGYVAQSVLDELVQEIKIRKPTELEVADCFNAAVKKTNIKCKYWPQCSCVAAMLVYNHRLFAGFAIRSKEIAQDAPVVPELRIERFDISDSGFRGLKIIDPLDLLYIEWTAKITDEPATTQRS